jgi:hypothetical protein
MRRRTIAITALALAIQALGPVSPAQAANPIIASFAYTGSQQSWLVPSGVTTIHAVLVGGRGGLGSSGALGSGGFGARVEADLSVSPGQMLFVMVGGNGGAGDFGGTPGAGGFNGGGSGGNGAGNWGGGGGGGASDLRATDSGVPDSLLSRLIVAAGGGGAGTTSGGNAGAPGADPLGGGGAGTSGAGGTGGSGSGSGSAGSIGQGGTGGLAFAINDRGGGGGGAGHYGGGGGGAASSSYGGGGGSSFTGAATNATTAIDDTGVPSVTITYVPDTTGGTVDATVTMASSAVCLELSTTAIDFGTRQFGEVGVPASPLIGVTNCSGIGEVILGRGTDATGPGGAAWSLATFGACQTGVLGTDAFRLRLESQAVPDVFVDLGTVNATLQALGAGATAAHEAQIDTPCPGSTGAGEVMSMQIVFTAIEEAAP